MIWMYILAVIFIILFFLFAYIRYKFKFWAVQPVFHVYDFIYYLFPPGIIMHELPEKNKYCNFKNIETIPVSKVQDFQIQKYIRFIQHHYLKNKDNTFSPQKKDFLPYFKGHNSECYFSSYTEDELLLDTKTNSHIENKKLISIMTSRPLHVYINNGNNDAFLDVYYIDYLCVDKAQRKNGIAPQIIQTHEYNQRLLNKKIKVSLFKREGELTGIVPLCVYNTYMFDSMNEEPTMLPNHLDLIEIGPKNVIHLSDFIKLNNTRFSIVCMVEMGNLIELIKTGNIYCYIVKQEYQVLCAYFFRKSCTFIGNNREILTCFASINCCKDTPTFVQGYNASVFKIKSAHPAFYYEVIEDISDNKTLIKDKPNDPLITSPTAYFFYNFAYPTFPSHKVLMLH